MTKSNSEEKVKQRFEKALNSQGYGFQYSVLKIVRNVFNNGSLWYPEVSEFPVVQGQGPGTRIDFILRHRDKPNLYLLAECKRVNPAYSDWCFVRSSFIHERRDPKFDELFLEFVQYDSHQHFTSNAKASFPLTNAYHIGLEVKSDRKGDTSGVTGKAIEDAATQLCRGLNGMVEFFSRNPKFLGNNSNAIILPVIFTTAKIWSSDIDLSTANLETGELDFDGSNFIAESWIAYQYHQSPLLKHSLLSKQVLKPLGEFMDTEYVRSIPIVSSEGIKEFLKWFSYRTVHL